MIRIKTRQNQEQDENVIPAAERGRAGEGGQAVCGLPGQGEVHHDPPMQVVTMMVCQVTPFSRHLCICENCQGPLRTHRNTCPICRSDCYPYIFSFLCVCFDGIVIWVFLCYTSIFQERCEANDQSLLVILVSTTPHPIVHKRCR